MAAKYSFQTSNIPALLLVDLLVPLVDLVQVARVQQSLLLQDEGVSIQTQLLQVSGGREKQKQPVMLMGKHRDLLLFTGGGLVLRRLRTEPMLRQKRDATLTFTVGN